MVVTPLGYANEKGAAQNLGQPTIEVRLGEKKQSGNILRIV
jgi:hypothetical protein